MPSVVRLIIRGGSEANSSATMPNLSSIIVVCSLFGVVVLGVALWYTIRFMRRLVGQRVRESNEPSAVLELGTKQCNQLPGSTISLPQRALLSVPPLSRDTSYETSTRAIVELIDAPTNPRRTPSPSFRISFTPPSKRSSYASTLDEHTIVISSFPKPPPKRLSSLPGGLNAPLPQLQGQTRIVRQKFTPQLPDELLLGKIGEELTIVKPFDDGWCLVSRLAHSASPEEPRTTVHGDYLGVVPAWSFMEPSRGQKQKPQRPVRRSSAGISAEMDVQFKAEAGRKRRSKAMSWSDF